MQSTDMKSNPLNIFLKTHEKIAGFMGNLVYSLESPRNTLFNVFFTFFACMIIRNFLESFSQHTNVLLNYISQELMGNLAHFDVSFAAIAMMLVILLHYLTKTPVVNVIKVIFPSFIIILLAPIIDLIASGGEGINLAYLSPEENISLLSGYFTFFGKFIGATPGIKIEVILTMISVYFYTYIKTRNIFTSLISGWLAYTAIYIWGASPFIIKPILELFGIDYFFSGLTFLRYFLILDFFLAIWILYLSNKKTFIAFVSEIPKTRVLHYEAMFLFGICLAVSISQSPPAYYFMMNPELVGNGILLMIAIFFALLSAMITNNLVDTEIDKISSPNRMLVSGKIQPDLYKKLAWIFAGCSLIYAAMTGMHGIFLMLFIIATYFLYSSWPLRLKRITVFSKLVISANSLALMLLGFWFITGNISDFPKSLYAILLCVFTLAANFIDLKDIHGDKAAGIKTLPVVLGMKHAQWFCAIAFLAAYTSFYFVFDIKGILLGIFIIAGFLQTWFLTRKDYNEFPVFLIYLVCIFLLMGHLITSISS